MNDYNNQNQSNNPQNPYNYGASNQTPPTYDYTQQPVPEQNVRKDVSRGEAIKTMVFGIIAAYFAWIPFTSIAGIIFGAIAKNKGLAIVNENPASAATRNFAKAGRITGKVGFIAGIIMTIFWSLYFILIIALLGEM